MCMVENLKSLNYFSNKITPIYICLTLLKVLRFDLTPFFYFLSQGINGRTIKKRETLCIHCFVRNFQSFFFIIFDGLTLILISPLLLVK